jgi:hypothetical protein
MKAGRAKLSTTVSAETYDYLEKKVKSGEASTLAEAVDISIARVRQIENRERLAKATTRYFAEMEPHAAELENKLARELSSAAENIDFDQEL